jgi:hypothetical protein
LHKICNNGFLNVPLAILIDHQQILPNVPEWNLLNAI